jgi:hypothetical protein
LQEALGKKRKAREGEASKGAFALEETNNTTRTKSGAKPLSEQRAAEALALSQRALR